MSALAPVAFSTRRSMSRPLVSRAVDLHAIARNLTRLRMASGTPVMAVVKADAFGHGAVAVGRAALAAGAVSLGVATIEEAVELRDAGISAPILAWLVDPWCDLVTAVQDRITVSCADLATLTAMRDAAVAVGRTGTVQLELDTGMARSGATRRSWTSLFEAAARIEATGVLRVEGVWSHLATASDPSPDAVADQVAAFRRGIALARGAGLHPTQLHLANSAATFAHPETRFTMIRPGAALYGIETVDGVDHGLESALRVSSRVTQVRDVKAGEAVGYGRSWIAPKATRVALVPVGYADGVPRSFSDTATLSVRGERRPIRGLVSMDQLVLEVGRDVAPGDEVVLLGDERKGEPTALEWARMLDTVPHEVLTGFGRRVPATFRQASR